MNCPRDQLAGRARAVQPWHVLVGAGSDGEASVTRSVLEELDTAGRMRFSVAPIPCRRFLGGAWNVRYLLRRTEREGADFLAVPKDLMNGHPAGSRAISHARVKIDKIDAKVLADLLVAGLMPAAWIGDERVRMLRRLVSRHRASMTSATCG